MHRALLLVLLAACSTSADKPAATGTPGVLSGTIDVAPDRKASVAQHAIFVSARRAGGGGPPLAAEKLAPGTLPLAFELSSADQMIAGGPPLEGDVELTVRFDADGDVMSRAPGDLVWKGPATVGGPPLTIVVRDDAR